MTCSHCFDHGIAIQEWTDADPDFAVCVCPAGQRMRSTDNNGWQTVPLWRLWCARWQIDPARVFLLDALYSAQELATAGLLPSGKGEGREAALLAAGRRRK